MNNSYDVADYIRACEKAEIVAKNNNQVIYVELTRYGCHVTTDATRALVGINPRGERQYLQ